MLWLVDAHNGYQSGLDIEQVAREGFSGLIVKATQGATGYTAPSAFDSWVRRARAIGMVPGAYHWLTSAPATAQLDHYLRRLDAVGGPEGMLCAVDVEDTATPPSWAVLRAFVDGWRSRTSGHPLLLYTGAWWWSPRGWPGDSLTPYLWASRYVKGTGTATQLYAKVPESWWSPGYGGWGSATVLQFSSKGQVAGKTVDVNAFRGTLDQLHALTRAGRGEDDVKDDERRWLARSVEILGAMAEDKSDTWTEPVRIMQQLDRIEAVLSVGATASLTDAQVSMIADVVSRNVGAVVVAAGALTDDDLPMIRSDMVEAVKAALRQGAGS